MPTTHLAIFPRYAHQKSRNAFREWPKIENNNTISTMIPLVVSIYMFINFLKTFFLQQRGTPPLRPPPRPQAKTCPPISRVFKRRQELFAAQSVTFLDSTESNSLTGIPLSASAHYDSTNKASYFEQVRLFYSSYFSKSFESYF